MDARRQSYWDIHDFTVGRGLEVGPLHRPIVMRDEGDVHYVDVTDRERLLEHYAGDPNVPAEAIPEIDYWLIERSGDTRTLLEAVKQGGPFDWVVASHVIEHIPNVIGWLDQLAEVTVDDGVLVLAVPDRRYCFDVHRPPTTSGQLLAAHYNDDQRPPIHAVYDYFTGSVDNNVHALWRGEIPTYASQIHDIPQALEKVQSTLSGEYVDCHVWLFTPESFLRQMHELRITGMSQWVVDRIVPTPVGDLEFKVVMRRVPRDTPSTGVLEGEVLPTAIRPDWVSDTTEMRALQEQVGRLQQRNDRLEARTDRLKTQLQHKSERLAALRARILEMESEPTEPHGRLDVLPAPLRRRLRSLRNFRH